MKPTKADFMRQAVLAALSRWHEPTTAAKLIESCAALADAMPPECFEDEPTDTMSDEEYTEWSARAGRRLPQPTEVLPPTVVAQMKEYRARIAELTAAHADDIAASIAIEREACAKICNDIGGHALRLAAANIRARGGNQP